MTWEERKKILARLGHRNFESEDHFWEWFRDQDNPVQDRIRKAFCECQP